MQFHKGLAALGGNESTGVTHHQVHYERVPAQSKVQAKQSQPAERPHLHKETFLLLGVVSVSGVQRVVDQAYRQAAEVVQGRSVHLEEKGRQSWPDT